MKKVMKRILRADVWDSGSGGIADSETRAIYMNSFEGYED